MDDKQNSEQQGNTQQAAPEANRDNKATTAERMFTQAEVDRIIRSEAKGEAKKLVAEQYADYEDLKAKAAKWQEAEDARKSEAEKLADRLTKLEEARKALEGENARLAQEKQAALIRAEVVAKATTLNFNDPSDAYRMLDLTTIKVTEDGKFEGIDEQLKALAEAKPYLLRAQQEQSSTPTPKMGATNPPRGGAGQETDAQRRARLFGFGSTPFGTANGGGMIHPEGSK